MKNVKQAISAALYGFGATIVAILLLLTAIGAYSVPFPTAMLPLNLRELASAWLAIGFLPMSIASVQMSRFCRPRSRGKKLLLYLPAAVCLGALLSWIIAWTVGLILMRG